MHRYFSWWALCFFLIAILQASAQTLTVAKVFNPNLITAGAAPTYSIDFFAISAGGNTLRGNCYFLSGTVGQPAPGYSSGSIDSLIAGYWQPAPTAATDEIFFNGFQGC